MNVSSSQICNRITLITYLLLFFTSATLKGQDKIFNYFYRIYFVDKGHNLNEYTPEDLISSRAIIRRQKSGISTMDFRDIPVCKQYIDSISEETGLTLHCASKWMNTALFKSFSPVDINSLLKMKFIRDVKTVKDPVIKRAYHNKLETENTFTGDAAYDTPLTMVKGDMLHNSGYNGKGILIAILDGGFTDAEKASSLSALMKRHGVVSTRDFLANNDLVYNSSNHGTAVLSVLAGQIPDAIEGSAPGADYLLLKTEDVGSEFPCEEDYWAAGAEYADSTGADIISSSLGYFTFDDNSLNYTYSDLNGKSAFITRVAEIAASKGILVVNSAGNERNKDWKYIIFPSDGDSVLATGAVDQFRTVSSFSSSGKSSSLRIKPDIVAMGVDIPVQLYPGVISRSNGTSFSCPVISGMAACLMQAIPEANNVDIINALHKCGDRYNIPDTLYGYGIPDFVSALNYLQNQYFKTISDKVVIYPDPTADGMIEILFSEPPGNFNLEIFSMTGKILFRKDFTGFAGRRFTFEEMMEYNPGMYLIRITSPKGSYVRKVIKIKV